MHRKLQLFLFFLDCLLTGTRGEVDAGCALTTSDSLRFGSFATVSLVSPLGSRYGKAQ